MKPTILVVDDERDLVNLVRYNLEKASYTVLSAYDGTTAQNLIWERLPDLIILDLMLPDRSGYDICREIKSDERTKKIPVIMLTARSSELDRVSGFEAGAEDYVVKPFSPKELVLRVKAMLGRVGKSSEETLKVGPVTVFFDEHRVLVSEAEVTLTQIEFKILVCLLQYPNVVKTREQILATVWKNNAEEVLDRTVDAHVKRLRVKLGSASEQLETVRGVGYRFSYKAVTAR